jgi:hypothetical protein
MHVQDLAKVWCQLDGRKQGTNGSGPHSIQGAVTLSMVSLAFVTVGH